MCNCSKQPCNNCSTNLPCNCLPVIVPAQAPVLCNGTPCEDSVPTDCVVYNCNGGITTWCCPVGTSAYQGPTPNYPNGYCSDSTGKPVNAIACPVCAPCANVAPGDTLTTIITKMCPTNPAIILQMLQVIAADTTYGLKNAFCQIANFCSGIPGSLTPFIGPATFTIP